MHKKSDVVAYAAEHAETTELLAAGKIRFT